MSAITDLNDVVNLMTGGGSAAPQFITRVYDGRSGAAAASNYVAGRTTSLWLFNSTLGSATAPGAVAVPDNTTAGGFRQVNPGGGRQLWLTSINANLGIAGQITLLDRLLHVSGLSGTDTNAQGVGGTLTRYTDGVGNMIMVEIYTIIGTTLTTAVINYTNQDGNPAVTPAFSIGGTGLREAGRTFFVPLDPADTGVQGVTDIDLVGTTGTAGNFGVNIVHRLGSVFVGITGASGVADLLSMQPGPEEILTDACIYPVFTSTAAAVPTPMLITLGILEK